MLLMNSEIPLAFVLCKNTVELVYSSFKVRNYGISSGTVLGIGADTIWCGITIVWDNVPSSSEDCIIEPTLQGGH